jgi:aminodeoxyfutalosine deaminase
MHDRPDAPVLNRSSTPMPDPTTTIYEAAAVRDAVTVNARPGAVAVRCGQVVAAGPPDAVARQVAEQFVGPVSRVDLAGRLLLPALVNAHAHLDLTDLGPQPFDGRFEQWLALVTDHRRDPAADAAGAVRRGLTASWRAGVGYLGDVAFSPQAVKAWMDWRPTPAGDGTGPDSDGASGPIPGVSYLECFGLGRWQGEALAKLKEQLAALPYEAPAAGHARGVLVGISPHAPYTVGLDLYEAVAGLGREHAYRLCTHVAESEAELQFVRDAAGPFVDLLKRYGAWDEGVRPTGRHPIDWLEHPLKEARWLLVHCNLIEDRHIALLHRRRASVAYCPIASDYFGFTRPDRPHRYRDMLAGGVNVCLGTDSIVCQPTSEKQPTGVLPQMRHLYRRDGADPATLLKMATTNGMLALHLNELDATLGPGSAADVIAVKIDPADYSDPLTQVLANDYLVERVC